MKKRRLIPLILIKNGIVVQSRNFNEFQKIGMPKTSVKRCSEWGSDELILLDISRENKYNSRDDLNFVKNNNFIDIVLDISKSCFMPITVGGKVRSLQDIENYLISGADKVAINTSAVLNPKLLDLASKKTDAFTSAGNTGAMLVGSIQILKPIAGVERPCLIAGVPKPSGNHGVILDVGANSDTKPEHLQQFAVLGSVYAKSILKMENPRVGLLNIGEEEEKGSILTKAAHQLLKSTVNINFVGNVEGRKVFDDEADVLVCDGFTGNVVLKVIEGFYYHLAVRGVNDDFMNLLNFKHHGGGLVLGVNAPVVVGHGISKSSTIVKMIELCINSVKSKYCDHVADAFRHVTAQNNQS